MENGWTKKFPLACSSLLLPLEECQKALEKEASVIEQGLTWLEEVKNEAFIMFSVKRNKLQMMPKTPGQKKQKQRKVKRKLSELDEEKENETNISNSKVVPTKLKFEECSFNSEKSALEEVVVNESSSESSLTKAGRPKRNTRSTKPVYNEDELAPRPTRQSRRHVGKSQAAKKPEISPSVRVRTKAYEELIKRSATRSPVYNQPPKGVDKMTPTSTKEPVPSKKSPKPQPHITEGKGKAGVLSDIPDEHKEKMSVKEMPGHSETNKKVVMLPTQAELQQLQQEEEEARMVEKESKQTKCPQLDETQVLVTEVFEYEGDTKALKLKEFEIVKSKSTPIAGMGHGGPKSGPSGSGDGSSSLKGNKKDQQSKKTVSELDVTQVVVTEVFEIYSQDKPALLKDREMVKIKAAPLIDAAGCLDSTLDQTSSDSAVELSSSSGKSVNDNTFSKPNAVQNSEVGGVFLKPVAVQDIEPSRSTRTRTRAMAQKQQLENSSAPQEAKDCGGPPANLDATFTKEDGESSTGRTTRTKTRLMKEREGDEAQPENEGSRTKTKKAKVAAAPTAAAVEPVKANVKDVNKNRCGIKRGVEERGLSPCPKRTRSYQLDKPLENQAYVVVSPFRAGGNAGLLKDTYKSPPRRSPRAFKFNSAQKKISGFTNRTPGFVMNTSRLFTFVKNTPQSAGPVHSFLKKSSPSPVLSLQVIQEQKKQKMLEKESRDMERLKKAAEMKKRKIEEMKRQREEKERKVAEIKEKRLKEEQELKERLNKKIEDQLAQNEKMMEARLKEEKERQKLRLKKQLEADARRKQDEEERLRKLAEQEKERLKQQEEEKKTCAQAEAQRLELQKLINKHNNTLKTNTSSACLVNQSATQDKSLNSYDLTPVKEKKTNVPNKDSDNYNIEDIGSDESTDDDEAPKKQIPKWATGIDLNVALIRQHANPPDLFTVFRHCCLELPDLEKIFAGTKKRRYKERTSSAIWN